MSRIPIFGHYIRFALVSDREPVREALRSPCAMDRTPGICGASKLLQSYISGTITTRKRAGKVKVEHLVLRCIRKAWKRPHDRFHGISAKTAEHGHKRRGQPR
jgi:hypothetical protein